MPLNGKRLADAGLSTSMMVAFAIPGGAPVGAGIAIVQFLFDALMDIFTPPPVPPPPPLTQAQLKAALDEIQSDIIDAIWKNDADTITADLLALNKGFTDVWANMKKLKMDGERYTVMAPDSTPKDWIADTKTYFDVDAKDGVLKTLRSYRTKIETSSLNDGSLTPTQVAEHRTRTTGLYCLISSLTISYLKAAIIWKWGLELLEAWQYQQYQKAVDVWNTKNAAYQAKHPLSEIQAQYPGLNLDPHYVPPQWNTWLNEPGCPVPTLIQEVQDILDYCVLIPDSSGGPGQPGLYALYKSRWDEYLKLIDSFDVAVDPNAGMTKAQMQLALSNGQKRIKDGGALLYKYSFTHITEPDIILFGKNVDAWRTASADVSFVNYAVVAGDTLIGLAQKTDGDATHVDKLFALNAPPLTDANLLPLGTVLKTYPKGTLQYATLPPKKGA